MRNTLPQERPASKKPVDKNLMKKIVRGTTCFHGTCPSAVPRSILGMPTSHASAAGGGNGWWKFEFCPGQHVRQYHVHADGRREYIVLGEACWDVSSRALGVSGRMCSKLHAVPTPWLSGAWDPAAHVARFLVEQADKPKRTRSFTHHYHDGAHCDAISQPRRVDVRYVCSSSMDEGQVTLTLEERATCEVWETARWRLRLQLTAVCGVQYVMTMRSTVVCEMLPLLDDHQVPVLP